MNVALILSLISLAQVPPGVSPQLVSEGDFAIELARELRLEIIVSTADGEATFTTNNPDEAAYLLTKEGIVPDDGYMSSMPMTPDIVEELRQKVNMAYCSGPKTDPDVICNERLVAFYRVVDSTGLNIDVCSDQCRVRTDAPVVSEENIVRYYTSNGAPVITYYNPPFMYLELYAWLPYPFWYSGALFPGYWMLKDFHRNHLYRGRVVVISNHFTGRDGRVIIVNPSERHFRASREDGRPIEPNHGRGGIPVGPRRPVYHPIRGGPIRGGHSGRH